MTVQDVYDRLFPEDNPTAVRRWRFTVSHVLVVLVVCMIFVLSAMTWGIPLLGQLVWTRDVEEMIEKRKSITNPAFDQLRNLSLQQQKDHELLVRFLAQTKAADIRVAALKRCRAKNSGERDINTREIDRLQIEYEALLGEPYSLPGCAEL